MKLYFAPGFCSLAPHIALRECGIDFSLERVNLVSHTLAKGGDYYAINPKGYVPLLEFADGARLTEVAVILQYIADLRPEVGLAPPNGTPERVRVQEALNFIATELHKGFSPVHRAPSPYKETAIGHLKRRFDYVETLLEGRLDALVGDRFSIADCYLYVVSNWLKFAELEIDAWPNFAAYVRRIADRPAVGAALAAEGL